MTKGAGHFQSKKQVSMTTIRNGAIPCSRIKMFAPSPEVFSAGKASTIAQRGEKEKIPSLGYFVEQGLCIITCIHICIMYNIQNLHSIQYVINNI